MDISESLETKPLFHSTFDHSRFKDQIVILVATHWYLDLIQKSLNSILAVLRKRNDVFVVILDNHSEIPIREYLNSIHHPRLETNFVNENLGKAVVINNYIRTYISESTLPRLFVVIDPDITFSLESFNALVRAAENIPRIGMLSMRYEKNICNPE
ncbi:MAG: glycosyltransferase, partial [Candidatus Margulisiibacteriota bacterium]